MPPTADSSENSHVASSNNKLTAVLVVENHVMVRDGLVALVNQAQDMKVCGSSSDSKEVVSMVEKRNPDVVVMDMYLEDDVESTGLIRELSALPDGPRILTISMHREEDVAERAARAGAHGFISKAESVDILLDTVRTIAANGSGFSKRMEALLLEKPLKIPSDSPIARLTAREVQVFRLIGSGLGLNAIASRLELSPKTVAAHRESLKNKLNCQSSDELARLSSDWLGIRKET